eukprot:6482613-Amphidinium_carterae.1
MEDRLSLAMTFSGTMAMAVTSLTIEASIASDIANLVKTTREALTHRRSQEDQSKRKQQRRNHH